MRTPTQGLHKYTQCSSEMKEGGFYFKQERDKHWEELSHGRVMGSSADTDLQVGNHVISAWLQVNPSDGYVLPGGFVSSQVHCHQVVQAPA